MGQRFGPVDYLVAVAILVGDLAISTAEEVQTPLATGPATEKRFPALVVPDGFKATLFACDPLVEYPSVIAIGPKVGTLFVAHDYVTGLGIEIVKRDEVRILSDADNDGYADKSQIYAGGFNSIQGLAHLGGTVFVMHAPLLTALRDTDGDGVADDRRDLLNGLGLPPEENSNRLHCANGVVVGHDGWLYLALGDRGCDVERAEGDRLTFHAGGILRCRTDGRDLHVFATGMRNIYDIALDEELNVFVRDNENDGGDFMIRVCHSFHGADHGYPYLYRERPTEAMRPLADLRRGSSAGGTAYLESAFPKEYRESLFFCEWGRAVVRYGKSRSDASFETIAETDFAAGAPTDPYGFKPTDLVVDYDGSMLISDWCDGQRPKRGRGRIYRISAADAKAQSEISITTETGGDELIALLNSKSHHLRHAAQKAIEKRIQLDDQAGYKLLKSLQQSMQNQSMTTLGRLHGVWIIAHTSGESSIVKLLKIARNDADPRVRAQAVRAVADLTDPVLVRHRLSVERGDPRLARSIADLAADGDPRVVLEVLIALGRLHWANGPQWLAEFWKGGDSARTHAAMLLLRRSDNWPAVMKLLDLAESPDSESSGLRTLVLLALGDQLEIYIADGLTGRLASESDPTRRGQYIDILARIHHQPAPWVYWGFRPAPRPANTVTWEGTTKILNSLNLSLADPNRSVRKIALDRMRREDIPIPFSSLADWLRVEQNPEYVAAILESLQGYSTEEKQPLLFETIASPTRDSKNRLEALRLSESGMTADNEDRLLDLARRTEDGPALAAIFEAIGNRPKVPGDQLLLSKLSSKFPEVRASAMGALGNRKVLEAASHTLSLLSDSDIKVRRAAAEAAGVLSIREAAPTLLKSAGENDPVLRRASLNSLRQLKEPGAVLQATDALGHPETQLAALKYLAEFGTVAQLPAVSKVAETNRASELLAAVGTTLSNWLVTEKLDPEKINTERQRIHSAIASLHGDSGTPIVWSMTGPVGAAVAESIVERMTTIGAQTAAWNDSYPGKRVIASGLNSVVTLKAAPQDAGRTAWIATAELSSATTVTAQFLASADGVFEVWLNGKSIFARTKTGAFRPDSEKFEGALIEGKNRLVLKLVSETATPRFHVRFRPKSSKVEHERLTQLLLAGSGNVERGRELFANAEKSLCFKCHRIGVNGGRIGPDLTGIGSRFSRIHLVESILNPSRTIAPSYASMLVILESGKVVTGVKTAESPDSITLGDKDGKSHTISRAEIEQFQVSKSSVMPEGMERRMTDRELTDLIAFLISQKNSPGK